jgi:hypothetical protein
VTPWTAPLQNTKMGGLAAQHAALTQATLGAASTGKTTLPQPLTMVPQALLSLASPLDGIGSSLSSRASALWSSLMSDPVNTLSSLFSGDSTLFSGVGLPFAAMQAFPQAASAAGDVAASAAGDVAASAAGDVAASATPLELTAPGLAGLGAGMGQANLLGGLSVPPSWAAATPLIPAAGLLGAGGGASPQTVGGPASMLGGVPWGAMAGRGVADGVNGVLKLHARAFAMPRPPAAG